MGTSPQGINTGGWGLKIKTEDIARFGQMYLQKGVWNGKPLLPEAWVAEATSFKISNGDNPESDWNQGYCYQFWRCRHNTYRGDGAFGQYCVVMPDQDAVLAITSGVPDMQAVLNLVWDCLLPAMGSTALPADCGGAGGAEAQTVQSGAAAAAGTSDLARSQRRSPGTATRRTPIRSISTRLPSTFRTRAALSR